MKSTTNKNNWKKILKSIQQTLDERAGSIEFKGSRILNVDLKQQEFTTSGYTVTYESFKTYPSVENFVSNFTYTILWKPM